MTRPRHNTYLQLAAIAAIVLVVGFYVFLLLAAFGLAGCGTDTVSNANIKGAWDEYTATQRSQDVRDMWGLKMTRIDNKDRSMGPFFSEHSVAFWDPSKYDEIEPNTLVTSDQSGELLSHIVSHGNPKDGWRTVGTYNNQPDGHIVTRNNYYGTYAGSFVSNGRKP